MVRRLFLGAEREDEAWPPVPEEERPISPAPGDPASALPFSIPKQSPPPGQSLSTCGRKLTWGWGQQLSGQ